VRRCNPRGDRGFSWWLWPRCSRAARAGVRPHTDLSSDDLIAVAALASDRHVRLEAVSVSGTGLVTCPAGGRLAADLLSALGRSDVPVACGRPLPLRLSHILPSDWRAAADHMFGLELPASPVAPQGTAVSLLHRAIGDGPRPPTIVELAPMTNLAELLQQNPELAQRIGRVVAMGGAFSTPGNAPGDAAAETNVWLDPAAADIVLRSGVPKTLVPLDATNDVPVTSTVSEVLRRYHVERPAATVVWDLILATGMDRGGQYFWDPLTALAVTHPALIQTATQRVAVTTAGGTIASPTGREIDVALAANRTAFEHTLLGTLLAGHRYVQPPAHADAGVTYSGTGCRYRGVRRIVAGPITVDTVNRSPRPFTWIAGRLDPGLSFQQLARWALDPRHAGAMPPWFTLDASGDTPPHSQMSWQAELPAGATGGTILACGIATPPRAWLLATIAVFVSR
jgi:inosine-uridine nucleoside N-ribohydrolase